MSKKLIVGLAIAGSLIAGGTAFAADTATDTKSKPAASEKAKPAKEDKAKTEKSKTDKSKTKSTAEATTPGSGAASADVNTIVVASQPVPDTKENRRAFPPLSALGRSTTPRGN